MRFINLFIKSYGYFMKKSKTVYKLIGFYENFNNSGKIKLKLTNSNVSIFCYIQDIKFISKYLSTIDNQYINQLAQYRN